MYVRTLTRELKKNLCCCRKAGDVISMSQSSSGRELLLYTYLANRHPNIRDENGTRPCAEHIELRPTDENWSEYGGSASCFVDVTLPTDVTKNCVTSHVGLQRKVTPPHISQGRGNRNEFDRYLLIWSRMANSRWRHVLLWPLSSAYTLCVNYRSNMIKCRPICQPQTLTDGLPIVPRSKYYDFGFRHRYTGFMFSTHITRRG